MVVGVEIDAMTGKANVWSLCGKVNCVSCVLSWLWVASGRAGG